jgi:hypothetical protein
MRPDEGDAAYLWDILEPLIPDLPPDENES